MTSPAPVAWGARSVENFENLDQIGEGTYGQVFMAKDKGTGEIVALKKVRMDNEKEGFPITAIREIKILMSLEHPNVVRLKEIVTSKANNGAPREEIQSIEPFVVLASASVEKPTAYDLDALMERGVYAAHESNQNKGSIYMVFEYMDHDLTGLADRPGMRFTAPQVKCYMLQLLKGLHYCHKQNVLHRDIKGSNLLINNKGILKLADFGLARPWSQEGVNELTNRVITLWYQHSYRPPELLLGANKYGPEIDMWSVGCILAELLIGKPILAGKNEMEQVNLIFKLCGSPTDDTWAAAAKLKYFHMFKPERPFKRRLRDEFSSNRFPNVTPEALDLIDRLLEIDPTKRISAREAIKASYFWTPPLPCQPEELPSYETSHEFPMKKRKHEARKAEEARRQQQQGHRPQAAHDARGGHAHHPRPAQSSGGGGYPRHPQSHSSGGGGGGGYGSHGGAGGAAAGRRDEPPHGGYGGQPSSYSQHGGASRAPMGGYPPRNSHGGGGPYNPSGGGGGGSQGYSQGGYPAHNSSSHQGSRQ